jgi:uncharacterized protein YgiM (DUF1202 family)
MRITTILVFYIISFVSVFPTDFKVNQLSFIAEDSINLRLKPDIQSDKVTSLSKFAKVTIFGINSKVVSVKKWKGRWLKVQYQDKIGYVLDTFLMKNIDSITELTHRDTYWEVDSNLYQIDKMNANGDSETQGALEFTKDGSEKVTWGTGEGQKYCFYKNIYSTGKQILIRCEKYGEEPDHTGEGERADAYILLEKVNKSTLNILNFGFTP